MKYKDKDFPLIDVRCDAILNCLQLSQYALDNTTDGFDRVRMHARKLILCRFNDAQIHIFSSQNAAFYRALDAYVFKRIEAMYAVEILHPNEFAALKIKLLNVTEKTFSNKK
jgi:hypothetical protein